MGIFGKTCLMGAASPSTLKKLLNKFPKFDKEKAMQFIKPTDGEAWSTPTATGNMVFTLHFNGMCSIHVRETDTKKLKEYFLTLTNEMAKKLKSTREELKNEVKGNKHSIIYTVYAKSRNFEIVTGLTTDNSKQRSRAAVITAYLQNNT